MSNLFNEMMEEICEKDKKIADLETKLAESEKSKESYRLQNDEHHLQLCQFYSRLGVEAFGADIHEKALETLMIMKEQLAEFEKVIEKYDCKSVKKLNGRLYRYDQYETKIFNMEEELKELKQQLAEKDQTIETILKENEELVKNHNVYTWGDEIQQDKIYAITGEALGFLISNQDKISFAVEKLEKVKDFCDGMKWAMVHLTKENTQTIQTVLDEIDNQIKQLKEMK